MDNNFVEENLEIRIEETAQEIRLRWFGAADSYAKDSIVRHYLYKVKDKKESARKKMVIDFSTLQYMNTGYIGLVTNYILSVSEVYDALDILLDTSVNWQSFTYKAFSAIFSTKNNVKVIDTSNKSGG